MLAIAKALGVLCRAMGRQSLAHGQPEFHAPVDPSIHALLVQAHTHPEHPSTQTDPTRLLDGYKILDFVVWRSLLVLHDLVRRSLDLQIDSESMLNEILSTCD